MLPLLQGGAKAKSDVYMLKNFVFENIPRDWMMQSEDHYRNTSPGVLELSFSTCDIIGRCL